MEKSLVAANGVRFLFGFSRGVLFLWGLCIFAVKTIVLCLILETSFFCERTSAEVAASMEANWQAAEAARAQAAAALARPGSRIF